MSELTDMIGESIDRMLDLDTVRLANAETERGEVPAVWQQLDDLGLEKIMLSEAEGGAASSWEELCEVVVKLAASGCPTRLGEEMVARALCAMFDLPQPEGRLSFAVSGHDLALEGGRVTGVVARVPWGRTADNVVTVVGDLPVLIPTEKASVREAINLGHDFRDTLAFGGVVASEGAPSETAAARLDRAGALLRSAQISGAANQAVDLTLDYALQRKQFDKPLVAFQAIQQQIAQMAEEALAATVAVRSASIAFASAEGPSWTAVAKSRTADASKAVCEISHQVHGAIGFTMEHHLRYFTLRMIAWRNEFGSPEMWAERLWDATCRAGEAPWPRIVEIGTAHFSSVE